MFKSTKKYLTLLSFNFNGKNLVSFFAVISLEKVKICVCVQVLKNRHAQRACGYCCFQLPFLF